MVAPLALVGAQLGKEPPLEAAVIRGVRSEGMLCSERELGLSQDHAGILALGADAPLGSDVAAYLHLDETVLDVEITPNRGDCLSILGLAREVAALFAGRLRAPRLRAAHSPGSSDSAQVSISVSIDAPDLVPALRRARDDRNQDRAVAGVAQAPARTVRDARAQQRRRCDQLRDARTRTAAARVRLQQNRGRQNRRAPRRRRRASSSRSTTSRARSIRTIC